MEENHFYQCTLRGIELCEVIIHNHHEAFTSKIFLEKKEKRKF